MKKRTPTGCPVVFTVDLLGDKWSLIILRDVLFNGKSHFREFLTAPEKIASNVLSDRLDNLIKEGMLTKQGDPANKSAAIYKPTKKALDLVPMLFELMRWGITYNPNIDMNDDIKGFLEDPAGLHEKILDNFKASH